MTGFSPPAPNGGTTIILAIDAWSKWLEYRIINPLDSRETSKFLFEDIIARYGTPANVRVDAGTEFEGDFAALCSQLGIVRRRISTLHPRANGLVERYNREVKSGIRRVAEAADARWFEVLPDVILALRMLPVASTGHSAYELAYK